MDLDDATGSCARHQRVEGSRSEVVKPGWAEKLGKEITTDPDEWQRIRARGGRPFKLSEGSRQREYARRGSKLSHTPSARSSLDRVLGKVEDQEE